MNKELRRVSLVVLAMFVALFVSSTYITTFQAESLRADPRNSRALLASYSAQRGPILVGGEPVAQSDPVDDVYKYQRSYPQPDLYAPVTGYYTLGQGARGIEDAMNEYLTGNANSQFFEQMNSLLTGQSPEGATVNLTLDPAVQQAAYDALGGNNGSIVAVEPSTGRILAMVSKQSYDPNPLASHDSDAVKSAYDALVADPSDPLQNKAIEGDLYVPGSTFKLITVAAALESGDYTPESTFPNPSRLTLPGTSTDINNAEGGSCGGGEEATIATALRLSCNIPMAQLGRALGADAMKEQAQPVPRRGRRGRRDQRRRPHAAVVRSGQRPRHAPADGDGVGRDRQRRHADGPDAHRQRAEPRSQPGGGFLPHRVRRSHQLRHGVDDDRHDGRRRRRRRGQQCEN
jgi:peptidoglycan glycosyltransferase